MQNGQGTATQHPLKVVGSHYARDTPDVLDAGLLVDERGEPLPARRPSLIERMNNKVSEDATLKKGTLAIIGLLLVLIQLAINFGGQLLGWTRGDQEVRTKVDVMSKQMDDLNRKVDRISETQQQQAIQSAKTDGFKTGVAASGGEQPK